jgi:hypothetical protein
MRRRIRHVMRRSRRSLEVFRPLSTVGAADYSNGLAGRSS